MSLSHVLLIQKPRVFPVVGLEGGWEGPGLQCGLLVVLLVETEVSRSLSLAASPITYVKGFANENARHNQSRLQTGFNRNSGFPFASATR